MAFMASILSPQYLEPSTPVATSQARNPQAYHCRNENKNVFILAAVERIDHTYHLGTCVLPGDASEKMIGLKVWHTLNTGWWQAAGAYVLCKKSYIAVGTLGVSHNPSTGQDETRADISIATQMSGSTDTPRDAVRKSGQERNTYPRLRPTNFSGRLFRHVRSRLALVLQNTRWKRPASM